jgi:hypothetical protein
MRTYNVKNPTIVGSYSQETHLDNHKEKEFLVEDPCASRSLKRIKSIKVVLGQLQRLPQNDSEHFSTEEKYLLKYLIRLIYGLTGEEFSEIIQLLNSDDSLL